MVQPGSLRDLGGHVRRLAPNETALLVQDRNVVQPHATVAEASLREAGYRVVTSTLDADEKFKTLPAVRRLYENMLVGGLDRASPVIAVGGGIVGDIAGFAAATYMRGTPFINVPTTLLAMVDAAIGGKTGVNFPFNETEHSRQSNLMLAKNMIGAFWPPRGVFADPDVLATLDRRHLHAGLAECIKHAMIADASLLSFIEQHISSIEALQTDAMTELIERSAAIKAKIVTEDEREAGPRMLLNLGHTFGHAIESQRDIALQHGEAIAIGLCAAMHVSVQRRMMSAEDADHVQGVIESCELPTRLPTTIDTDQLLDAMRVDKKRLGGKLRLVLPLGLGRADVFEDVDDATLRDAWRSIGAG